MKLVEKKSGNMDRAKNWITYGQFAISVDTIDDQFLDGAHEGIVLRLMFNLIK